jgi:hypothetical protein
MKYKVFIEMTLHTGKEGFSVVVNGNDEDDAEQNAIFEMKQEYKNIASYFVDEVNELEYEFTIDDWEEKYKPMQNPRKDADEGFDSTIFETHHEGDYEVLKGYDINRLWTLLEGEDGMVIISGYHRVNRLGYFITENPVEEEDKTKEYFAE